MPWQIVSDFEAGKAIGPDAEDEIINAFSAVGVFVLASAGEGYGLRLAKSAETLQDLVQLAQGREAQSFKLARGKARLIEYCACWDQDAAHTNSAMDELDARIAGEIARRSRVRGWDAVCFLLAAWRSWIAEKDACGYEVV